MNKISVTRNQPISYRASSLTIYCSYVLDIYTYIKDT